MSALGEAIVVAVDTSISMREKDFKPNRIVAARHAVRRFVGTAVERDIHTLIGIMVFYMYAFPLVDLEDDVAKIDDAIEDIRIMGEATAPGLAIGESINMLRHAPPGYLRRIVMVTDGTFNEGVPLDVAAGLAARSGIPIDILSFGKLSSYDREMMKAAVERTMGIWRHAETMEELLAYASELASRIPETGKRSIPSKGWR